MMDFLRNSSSNFLKLYLDMAGSGDEFYRPRCKEATRKTLVPPAAWGNHVKSMRAQMDFSLFNLFNLFNLGYNKIRMK
jgi:hypothetical protein